MNTADDDPSLIRAKILRHAHAVSILGKIEKYSLTSTNIQFMGGVLQIQLISKVEHHN